MNLFFVVTQVRAGKDGGFDGGMKRREGKKRRE
jgi:hypothetical protein